jgi:nitroreductase
MAELPIGDPSLLGAPLPDGELSQAAVGFVDEILSTARSVRRHLDFQRPLAPEVIYQCIDVAVQAPAGAGGENCRFLVVTEPEIKARIAAVYAETLHEYARRHSIALKASHRALIGRLHEIPAMIFVCVDGLPADPSQGSQVAYYGSVLPAAWSLMLALRARGIGTTWTSLLCQRREAVAAILDLPDQVSLTVMLPAGYTRGAVLKRAARRPASEVTFWNRWGSQQP